MVVADGVGVAAGFGVAGAADFFAGAGGFAVSFFSLGVSLGASFFAAGLLSAAGGVSDICADAPDTSIRLAARIDIGRKRFIRPALFRTLRHAPA
jgi:hypothetical protein